jgi:hypothetical protein
VSWTVQGAFGAPTGAEITAQARVSFDNQAPFETRTVTSISMASSRNRDDVNIAQAGGSDYLVKWQA